MAAAAVASGRRIPFAHSLNSRDKTTAEKKKKKNTPAPAEAAAAAGGAGAGGGAGTAASRDQIKALVSMGVPRQLAIVELLHAAYSLRPHTLRPHTLCIYTLHV